MGLFCIIGTRCVFSFRPECRGGKRYLQQSKHIPEYQKLQRFGGEIIIPPPNPLLGKEGEWRNPKGFGQPSSARLSREARDASSNFGLSQNRPEESRPGATDSGVGFLTRSARWNLFGTQTYGYKFSLREKPVETVKVSTYQRALPIVFI